ncbi:hypothetical protein ACJRO7_026547, partial [Eucalyptus globulus]
MKEKGERRRSSACFVIFRWWTNLGQQSSLSGGSKMKTRLATVQKAAHAGEHLAFPMQRRVSLACIGLYGSATKEGGDVAVHGCPS